MDTLGPNRILSPVAAQLTHNRYAIECAYALLVPSLPLFKFHRGLPALARLNLVLETWAVFQTRLTHWFLLVYV
jgi:hypothetical protein